MKIARVRQKIIMTQKRRNITFVVKTATYRTKLKILGESIAIFL